MRIIIYGVYSGISGVFTEGSYVATFTDDLLSSTYNTLNGGENIVIFDQNSYGELGITNDNALDGYTLAIPAISGVFSFPDTYQLVEPSANPAVFYTSGGGTVDFTLFFSLGFTATPVSTVPEPSSLVFSAVGIFGIGILRISGHRTRSLT